MLRRLRATMLRLFGHVGAARRDKELDEELASHLQMAIDDSVRAGLSPADARRAALIRMGGIEAVKEAYRDRRALPLLEALLQDARFGWRTFRRQPGFAATAVATLACGIAANVVIFGIANALFFRPPAIADPSYVVRVYSNRHSNTSYAAYEQLRDRNQSLAGLAIFQGASLSVRTGGEPEHAFGMAVSGNYFDVLGLHAALGRTIETPDDRPGAAPVVVLSDRVWRARFNGDPAVLGRPISVNGQPYTVAGVAPANFDGMLTPFQPDLFLAWNGPALAQQRDPSRSGQRGARDGHMIGRLFPNVRRSQAQADLSTLAATIARENAGASGTVTVYGATTLVDEVQPAVAAFVGLLFAVVGVVLLIACTNVATLLLARASARRVEISIRTSLGASRRRVIAQLLTESLMLAAAGGIAAVALAAIATTSLETAARSLPTPIPVSISLDFDWRVLAFTSGLTLLTTIAFGLAPALRASTANTMPAMREGASTAGRDRSRLRAALVSAQIALSALLLITAAILVRSTLSAQAIDRGFDSSNVVVATVDLETRGHTPETGARVYERLVERLEAMPGAQAAHLIDIVPLTLSNTTAAVLKEGQEPPAANSPFEPVYANAVTRGHFRTLGIPLVAGRDFADADRTGRPDVAIVNQTMARRFWPRENPIGKRVRIWNGGTSLGPSIEVIGVARDSKYATIGEAPKAFMYRPLSQAYLPIVTMMVRTSVDRDAALAGVRAAVQAVDSELSVFNLGSLDAATGLSLLPVQAAATLAGGLGLVALILVSIGIYGVVSYLVRQRTREIGIRLALGAGRATVIRELVRQSMRWTIIGLAIGIAMSIAVTKLLSNLLYGVVPTDAVSFAVIVGVLFLTAYSAAFVPARRATDIDPAAALRHES